MAEHTPFHAEATPAGAAFVEEDGWHIPDRRGALAGPRAAAVLAKALREPLPELQEFQHVESRAAGDVHCQVRRHDPLGVPGFDILCPAKQAEGLWEALTDAGARPAGQEAFEVLRIEAGTPREGVDSDENNLIM